MSNLVRYKGGLSVTYEQAKANKTFDDEQRKRLRCGACGRKFSNIRPQDNQKKELCQECAKACEPTAYEQYRIDTKDEY